MLLLSRISMLVVIALVAIVIATARADLPPIIQSTTRLDKLPINVEPLEYDIKLELEDSFDEFTGEVDIFVMFKSCKNPVARLLSDVVHGCLLALGDNMNNPEPRDRIALHIRGDLNIENVQLLVANSIEQLRLGEGDILHITNIEQDQLSDTILINLDTEMPVGFYGRISIKYHASRRLKIYSETIYDAFSKRKIRYHAINLEQFKARTLFPCFDESTLRAKIRLTIDHPYMDSSVLANIPSIIGQEESFGSFKRSRFQQSVPVPISSLAFAIGPYQRADSRSHPSLDQSMNSIKVNFFEPSGHRGEGEFALKAAISAVHWFEKRFRLHEHTKDLLHHINLVAVPSFKEWKLASALGIGLIDHNFLLIDDRFSSPERKIETALYTTLVVARQLFGHVMVPKSADDQWIADGLAYHLAIRAVDDFRPDFKVEQYVRAHHRRRVMFEVERERQHSGDSRYQLSPRAQCILRHLKGKGVFDSLRANIVHGHEKRFDAIIRNLIEKTTTSGVSRSDLIEAFAIDKFSSKQIDRLIRGMLSSPLNSRLDVDLIMDKSGAKLQLRRRSSEGVITLPVEMNVFTSSSNGGNLLNIPVYPIRRLEQANGKFVTKLPKWFYLDHQAWLKVELGDGQLLPNHQVHYNKAIFSRLRDQIITREMDPNDRLAILSQQIDTVDASSMDEIWEFIEFIGYYQEEDNPDVILEVLEAMKWAIQWVSRECLHYFEDHLTSIYHRLDGFKATGNHDTISKQRAKATVALLLINQIYDTQTIDDGVAIYDQYHRAHEQLPGFLRTPVFMAVGVKGSTRQKEELGDRLEDAGFAEEQSRYKLLRPLKCSAMRNTGRCLRDKNSRV